MADEKTYTLRMTDENGVVHEVALSAGQVLDLGQGRAIAYFPSDEQVLVDDDGTIIRRESAVPRPETQP